MFRCPHIFVLFWHNGPNGGNVKVSRTEPTTFGLPNEHKNPEQLGLRYNTDDDPSYMRALGLMREGQGPNVEGFKPWTFWLIGRRWSVFLADRTPSHYHSAQLAAFDLHRVNIYIHVHFPSSPNFSPSFVILQSRAALFPVVRRFRRRFPRDAHFNHTASTNALTWEERSDRVKDLYYSFISASLSGEESGGMSFELQHLHSEARTNSVCVNKVKQGRRQFSHLADFSAFSSQRLKPHAGWRWKSVQSNTWVIHE